MIHGTRRRLIAATVGVVILALTACSSSGSKSGDSQSGGLTKITIAYSQKVGDEIPLWIAKEAGYFKKNGLDVTLRYLKSNAGIPALLSDQVQIASIGGSDALSAAAQGADLKYVLTLAPVYTYQFYARPQYADASKLAGQRVGVTSTSGSLYAGTVVSLDKLGLKPSDVQIVSLGSVPNVDSALLSGSIAAAASHPPGTFQYKKEGFTLLVDLAKQQIPNANSGFTVRADYLDSHGDVVQRAITSVVQAIQREKSDKAFADKMIRKYMEVKDQAIADFTYDYYAKEVAVPVPLPKIEQFEATQRALGAKNPQIKDFDLTKLIEQKFVKTSAKKLGVS